MRKKRVNKKGICNQGWSWLLKSCRQKNRQPQYFVANFQKSVARINSEYFSKSVNVIGYEN